VNLNVLWFLLVGVLMCGYAILDGFDLGVGILHPFIRGEREKRLALNAIGPLWDGNEVWLIVFGGALFACFPDAYATIFSGFYMAFMLLLTCLILRAVSMEFRGKVESSRWKAFFDAGFAAASTLATFLFGVATGNVLVGLPIGADKEFVGSFWTLIRPYPVLIGVLAVAMFALHGAIFLYQKTEGELQARVKGWLWTAFGVFATLYVLTTMFTLVAEPQVLHNFRAMPVTWIVPVLNVLAVANIPRALYTGKPGQAFVSSCLTFAAFVFLLGMALFPNLVPSSMNPAWSLTIYNAASSQKTLGTAALIALIGMPIVLTYTTIIYWVFRGKVRLSEFSSEFSY
jgi:cytochrome d ubiquinol oxidase subunit II